MKLFSPLQIKGLTFKNRAVMAPMVTNMAAGDGAVTGRYRDFYLARARGGVGYIVLGAGYVLDDGRGFSGQLGIDRDDLVPGLSEMVRALGEHTRVGVQLSYKSVGRPPESFSLDRIDTIRKAFVRAAVRARECGFDAIELHACHDYWLNYFLSPFFNGRDDEYGGDLDNRYRLLGRTVKDIRSAVGEDFVLGVRLSLEDFMDGGLGLGEALEVGRRLEAVGVDYISASVGIGLTQYRMSPPSDVPRSSELILARAMQETVSIPVIGVGRLDRPDVFRAAVEEGYVGMAAAARALIADPDFVRKIEEGRDDEIRPCLACNHCLTCLHRGEEVRCVVNPLIGRDLTEPEPLPRPLDVLVVGGGPAGLTAAAAAARRGAKVRLVEKSSRLGGALNVAQVPPFKDTIGDFADFLVREARRAGVGIELNRAVDLPSPAEGTAEAVILAYGARPFIPSGCGLDGDRVQTAEAMLRSEDVPPGRYLVIGGGLVGLETAEYLCERGADVTVVEMLPEMGAGLGPMRLKLILDRLIKAGANLLTGARLLAVEGPMARLRLAAGEVTLGPFEQIVAAVGYVCNEDVTEASAGEGGTVIGDARRPRSILEAVAEGLDAALSLE